MDKIFILSRARDWSGGLKRKPALTTLYCLSLTHDFSRLVLVIVMKAQRFQPFSGSYKLFRCCLILG